MATHDEAQTSRPGTIVDYSYSDSSGDEEVVLVTDSLNNNAKQTVKTPDLGSQVSSESFEIDEATFTEKLEEILASRSIETVIPPPPDDIVDVPDQETESAECSFPPHNPTIHQDGPKVEEERSSGSPCVSVDQTKEDPTGEDSSQVKESSAQVDFTSIIDGLEQKYPINYKSKVHGCWRQGTSGRKFNNDTMEVIDQETRETETVPKKCIKPWSAHTNPDTLNHLDGVRQQEPSQSRKTKSKYDTPKLNGLKSSTDPKSDSRGRGKADKSVNRGPTDLKERGLPRDRKWDKENRRSSLSKKSVETKSDQECVAEVTSKESSSDPLTPDNSEVVVESAESTKEDEQSSSLNDDSGNDKALDLIKAQDREAELAQNNRRVLPTIPEETSDPVFTVLKERDLEKAIKKSVFEPLESFAPDSLSTPHTIPETKVGTIEDFLSNYQIKREGDISKVVSMEEPRKILSDLIISVPISEAVRDDLSVCALTEIMRRGDPELLQSVLVKCQESFPQMATQSRGSQVNFPYLSI